jgi:hypothetical protein
LNIQTSAAKAGAKIATKLVTRITVMGYDLTQSVGNVTSRNMRPRRSEPSTETPGYWPALRLGSSAPSTHGTQFSAGRKAGGAGNVEKPANLLNRPNRPQAVTSAICRIERACDRRPPRPQGGGFCPETRKLVRVPSVLSALSNAVNLNRIPLMRTSQRNKARGPVRR